MGTEIDGVNGIIKNTTSDGDVTIKGNDGGSEISALVFDMSAAGAATFNGKITADAGIDIDNFNIDGTTIALSSGDITLDAAGDIILDADGGDIRFKDGGTEIAVFENSSSDLQIKAAVQDKDIIFRGNDGGAGINALVLDMSDAGTAKFNHNIKAVTDDGFISSGASDDLIIFHDGTDSKIYNSTGDMIIDSAASDKDIILKGSDGGSAITALTLDMSAAGLAIFNAGLAIGGTGAANTLDDYEEGTYDVTMTVNSGSLTPSGSSNALAYTKIGRVVHVQGEIRFSAISSPSGAFSISLPFAVADLADGAARFTSGAIGQSGFNGTPNQTYYFRNTNEGTTGISVSTHNSGSDINVNANQVTTNTEMIVSFTFVAA